MDLHYYLWLFFRYLLIALIFIYFIGGINELIIDLFYYSNRIYRRIFKGKLIKPLTRAQLNAVPEKTMAIMLPAWNEGKVISQMLLNTLGTVDYKNYYIFIGTYPNDPQTQEAVGKIQEIYPHLVMTVNSQNGPTNKADCLNVIHDGIRAFELEKGIKFDILILHDAEDVVHPLSLKLYNYLMPRMSMIQLPVLPLEAHWYQFTRGVYMDEFAELHLKEMLTREKISSALPSAGVGTAFIHEDLEFFGRHNGTIFNPQTITEDYEIGMRLSRHGKKSIILHQFLERVVTKKKWFGRGERQVKVKDLIATREYFPKHFWKAVKQRARWTYGISIQGWRNLKWDHSIGKNYFLMNDRRSIFGNIFNFLGYFVFFYWITLRVIEYFYDSFVSPPLIQKDEIFWKLAVIVLFFFLWKIINRAITVNRLYGGFIALLSVIRIFHGNLINFFAALMAIKWYVRYLVTGKEPGWIQTEHQYPTEIDLQLFQKETGGFVAGKSTDHHQPPGRGLGHPRKIRRPVGRDIGKKRLSKRSGPGGNAGDARGQPEDCFFMRNDLQRNIFFILLAVFITIGVPSVEGQNITVPPDFPLPITSQKYTEAARAKIFFKLYPIFSNAYESLDRREYGKAERFFKTILDIDPGNNLSRYYLVQIYSQTGQPRKVLTLTDQLLAKYPDYIQGHLSKGYALWALKDYPAALQAFDQALTLSPKPKQKAEILRALGESQMALQQYERAASSFQQAHVFGERPEDLFKAAGANKKQGRYEAAEQQFSYLVQQALTPRPLVIGSYVELARMAVTRQESKAALDFFLKVLELDPEHPEAIRGTADCYFLLGRREEGLPYAERLVIKEPQAENYILLGAYEEKLGHPGPAAEAYDRAAGLTQDTSLKAEVYHRQGMMALKRGQPAEAQGYFEKALPLSKTPGQRSANRRGIGQALAKEKKFEQAALYFQESLRDQWDEPTARLLFTSLREEKQWERIIATGENLLKNKKLSSSLAAQIRQELLVAFRHLGQEEKVYQLTIELAGQSPGREILGEAADAARKTGRLDEALADYERVLTFRFDPQTAMDRYYLLKQKERYAEGENILLRVMEHPASGPRWRQTAEYELAQVYRLTRRDDLYLQRMESLVRTHPFPSLHLEYAEALIAGGRTGEALSLYLTVLDSGALEERQRCDLTIKISDIYLDQKKPQEAIIWLERLEKQCPMSPASTYKKALALFQLGEYQQAIRWLKESSEREPSAHLYLAFAYYKQGETGLALAHLEKVETGRLSAEERYAYASTRAYLLFDQSRFEAALGAAGEARALRDEKGWFLFRLKSLVRMNCPPETVSEAEAFLGEDPPADMAAEAEKILGICHLAKGENPEAISRFSRSLQQAAQDNETYYLRGMAYYRDKKYEEAEKDFVQYLENNPNPNPEFYRDLGFVLWGMDKRKEGLEAWEKELQSYPSDLNTNRNAGYGYFKMVENEKAQEKFGRAIDIYRDKLLYLQGEKYIKEFDEMHDTKVEYTKLDKTWGAEAYVGKTDLVKGGAGTIFNGAIPSQFGAQLSYRPPVIGFRDEREFDVFARFLGNFEPDSWSPDKDSYQLGLGVAYKPLRFLGCCSTDSHPLNYFTSFERLIKIGENAENNWLWRNRLSMDWDQPPKGGRNFWVAPRLYGEASYFLEDPTRWVFYAAGRLGVTWRPFQQLWITPQILGDYRYETNQNPVGCYREIGLGVSGRIWEGEKKYTVDRWYLEVFLGYKWGRFEFQPAGMSRSEYEGFFCRACFFQITAYPVNKEISSCTI